LAQRDRLGTKAPDRDAGAVDSERRYDDVDARAVRQPGVDDWAGSVGSQAERRHDPLDQLIGVAGCEPKVGCFEEALALDPDRASTVDHDLRDVRIAEQRLEGVETGGPSKYPIHEVVEDCRSRKWMLLSGETRNVFSRRFGTDTAAGKPP